MSNFSKAQSSKGGSTTARLKRDADNRIIELLLVDGIVTPQTEGIISRYIASVKRDFRSFGRGDLAKNFEHMMTQEIASMILQAENAYDAIRASSVGRWQETYAERHAALVWLCTLQSAANVARIIAAFNAAK